MNGTVSSLNIFEIFFRILGFFVKERRLLSINN